MMDEKIKYQLIVLYVQIFRDGRCYSPIYINCEDCILGRTYTSIRSKAVGIDKITGALLSCCIEESQGVGDITESLRIIVEMYKKLGGTEEEMREYIVEYLL